MAAAADCYIVALSVPQSVELDTYTKKLVRHHTCRRNQSMKYVRKVAKSHILYQVVKFPKTTYPGEFLFSSPLDNVIEIIET